MDCRRMDQILNEHAFGALDAAAKTDASTHLGRCSRCADAWLSHDLLSAERPESPRPGFYRELIAAVNAAPVTADPARRRLRIGRAVGIAAAAVLVLVLAGLVVPERDAERPAAEATGATAEATGATAASVEAGIDPAVLRQDLPADTPRLSPATGEFLGGVHYEILVEPLPSAASQGKIEVCEFFMFPCEHCFDIEAKLSDWSQARADTIELVRVPVLWTPVMRLQARAFYTAEVLGLADELMAPFFEEIHRRGNALASEEALREFFARHGVAAEAFDEAFASRAVERLLGRAEDLNRRYGIESTPTFGVNGRFVTNASMAGSSDAIFDVIDALVAAEDMPSLPVPSLDFRR